MKNWMIWALRSALILTPSAPLMAGWASGGGILHQEANNPWFLQNMRSVSACILHDAASFHLPSKYADLERDYLAKVIAYWQSDLQPKASTKDPFEISTYPIVGTQTFSFGPCTDETDVRFQFGVLSAEQKAQLHVMGIDPRQLVSIAIRSDYDAKLMKGKGFVYVAADAGELRPSPKAMMDDPWVRAEGKALLLILAHELGHVFGVGHTPNGVGSFELMNALLPEIIVHPSSKDLNLGSRDTIYSIFKDHDEFPKDANNSSRVEIKNLNPDHEIFSYLGASRPSDAFIWQWEGQKLPLFGRHPKSKEQFKLGEITLIGQRSYTYQTHMISVWLPREQNVIKQEPGTEFPYMSAGPVLRDNWIQYGNYLSESGQVHRQVFVKAAGGGTTMQIFGLPDRESGGKDLLELSAVRAAKK